ncbi:pyroglutamyl-peptidase I family protein [Leptothoe kymatousa]|uniref:Peptidase C15 n=1 Tax=Leptothoe kymatousa TAU-MAC 1615 TaxID=2364775 RepID=A0ABS5Y957_9CYAN|nr:peptidase C15 [Leptothoe kymatousa]MBT9313480.1 peptidase C15 [Leptothoe kymatousa TAU-MAC 1615]
MASPILITSFCPWKAHQGLNSSDVLLAQIAPRLPPNAVMLRQLPVNFDLAPMRVINQIVVYRPKVVICCGMAETRDTLTVERWGTYEKQALETPIDLANLIDHTVHTHISEDAGDFVCNRLYYRVLKHVQQQSTAALFVHVPLIKPANNVVLEFDFLKIVEHLNHVC